MKSFEGVGVVTMPLFFVVGERIGSAGDVTADMVNAGAAGASPRTFSRRGPNETLSNKPELSANARLQTSSSCMAGSMGTGRNCYGL